MISVCVCVLGYFISLFYRMHPVNGCLLLSCVWVSVCYFRLKIVSIDFRAHFDSCLSHWMNSSDEKFRNYRLLAICFVFYQIPVKHFNESAHFHIHSFVRSCIHSFIHSFCLLLVFLYSFGDLFRKSGFILPTFCVYSVVILTILC